MSALRAIYTALATKLANDAQLITLLAPSIIGGGPAVFNDVPEGQAYPHIDIGTTETSERPWDHFGGPSEGGGFEDKVAVHIWSRYQGDQEALTIYERVMALLHYQAVAVAGFDTVLCSLDHTRALVEQVDKIETRHLVAVFVFKVGS